MDGRSGGWSVGRMCGSTGGQAGAGWRMVGRSDGRVDRRADSGSRTDGQYLVVNDISHVLCVYVKQGHLFLND